MEADWEIEIGGDAPVIGATWPGLIDLRADPKRVYEIAEASLLPGLAQVLLDLNAPRSPLWTSKCDLWEPPDFDPDEMEADRAQAKQALACYLDLLPRGASQWTSPEMTVAACKSWCRALHSIALPNCRADFIVRRACITPDCESLGVTAYVTACGADLPSAQCALTNALVVLAKTVASDSSISAPPSK
jgi:hypothetical protein